MAFPRELRAAIPDLHGGRILARWPGAGHIEHIFNVLAVCRPCFRNGLIEATAPSKHKSSVA
jgi:hypothetical protein